MSSYPTAPESATGINITATFNPLSFLLYLFPPKMGVNGSDFPAKWKTPVFVPVAPGQHTVVTYFPYMFYKEAGKGTATVVVNPGQVVNVKYKAPWLVFMAGKMIVS